MSHSKTESFILLHLVRVSRDQIGINFTLFNQNILKLDCIS